MKPEQITPTFAPEMQFNVEVVWRTAGSKSTARRESPARRPIAAAQEKPEWRGVQFSALND